MRHIPNYELKSQLLKDGMIVNLNREYRKTQYFYSKQQELLQQGEIYTIPSFVKFSLTQAERIKENCLNDEKDAIAWQEAERINNAFDARKKRLRERNATFIATGKCLFLTLTFTDKVLSSTSEETRKQYVRKFLKTHCEKYIANIDYGGQTDREHYHAIVVADYLEPNAWQYGISKIRKVPNSENPLILAKYISKLTNHAIKETTKRNHLIYSR